ncbi:MAG TPA: GNAT family N-acetyltransferase [Burkholderiaceae bacterium]|nr:GNAT family N-acetyltransferase [Burkholderiaceae bacterium]
MTTIRLATPADAKAIAALSWREVEQHWPWHWNPPSALSAMLDRDANVALALGADGQLVGFGVMEYHDDTAHLSLLVVNATARRRGIGTMLLRWLERVAAVAAIARIEVEERRSDTAALAFYASRGYVRSGVSGYYVRLCKALAQGGGAAARERSP